VCAYHDLARDSWFVEKRMPPDAVRRHRWYDLTEQQAADTRIAAWYAARQRTA
jgi:hypothetical protein